MNSSMRNFFICVGTKGRYYRVRPVIREGVPEKYHVLDSPKPAMGKALP